MNLFNSNKNFNKEFWKQFIIGALEGLAWFIIIALLVFEFNEGVLSLVQYMNDHVKEVWPIFLTIVLPLFVLFGIVFKIVSFAIKYGHNDGKKTKVATKTTTRKTTAKKKTAKK